MYKLAITATAEKDLAEIDKVMAKRILNTHTHVPLAEVDPDKIRETLLDTLEEQEQQESLIDILARVLKF